MEDEGDVHEQMSGNVRSWAFPQLMCQTLGERFHRSLGCIVGWIPSVDDKNRTTVWRAAGMRILGFGGGGSNPKWRLLVDVLPKIIRCRWDVRRVRYALLRASVDDHSLVLLVDHGLSMPVENGDTKPGSTGGGKGRK